MRHSHEMKQAIEDGRAYAQTLTDTASVGLAVCDHRPTRDLYDYCMSDIGQESGDDKIAANHAYHRCFWAAVEDVVFRRLCAEASLWDGLDEYETVMVETFIDRGYRS